MRLYGFPPSPNTWKVRAVAAQLGIPLDLELVDLTKPRTADYLALNPTGRTPTLVDGDFMTVTERSLGEEIEAHRRAASDQDVSPVLSTARAIPPS